MSLSDLKALALPRYKEELDSEIARGRLNGESDEMIIRRLFYFWRSPISRIHENPIFNIFNAVAVRFGVPFKSIYVSGSAQTAHSLYKNTDFTEGESDLDLAIVDASLFQKYSEISYIATDSYRNLTKFPTRSYIKDVPSAFRENLARGYFRPDLMPACEEQKNWKSFFNDLSTKHIETFKSVNCGIYLSPIFFERKLIQVLENYKPKK